ncbi:MAG: 4Fe-4S dicluster domain-containing protein [Coriobacteriia bacterium]|nr:4Fe-4S dicluster domain-containing protein [Coriobacteriia bacterium]
MADMAIFYDASKCTACKGCQVACKQWNQLPSPLTAEEFEFTKSYQSPLDLSENTWVIMTFDEVDQDIGVEWNFMRRACFHCTDAACEQACPVGAISHADNGAVIIDQEKCIGCRYCVNSCPFSVPHWNENENKTFKCRLCADRTANGREPACVTTCPTGALAYGERTALVDAAKARLEQVKAEGFGKAELYGVDELDGMHVLSLAHRGLEAHGLDADPQVPGTVKFWQLLKPLSGIAFAATVGGLAVSFLTGIGYKQEAPHEEEEVRS